MRLFVTLARYIEPTGFIDLSPASETHLLFAFSAKETPMDRRRLLMLLAAAGLAMPLQVVHADDDDDDDDDDD